MKSIHLVVLVVGISLASTCLAGTRADLSGNSVVDFATTMDMPFMTVGNAGNAGEWSGESHGGRGYNAICGAVDYTFNVAKFEVTAGQYTEFLNAVATTDTHGLYASEMWTGDRGCKIQQAGVSGNYSYSVASDMADRPVNYMSWGDAARFANWLTNGMPTGVQDLSTTEDGSYFLNGAVSNAALKFVVREDDARFVIPTEDEWYKAAYHMNDGVTGNYYDYPTSSNALPSNDLLASDPGNSANFAVLPDDYTVSSAGGLTTLVGDFENSASSYGAFDMGGNVWEWNETPFSGPSGDELGYRGIRGGHMYYDASYMAAASRNWGNVAIGVDRYGFRIAEVPEPATMGLLALGTVALLKRRNK